MPGVERIYPHGDSINFQRHIARYEFARFFIELDEGSGGILDFMCGCGYGSDILSRTQRSVVGFDKDIEAVNYAQRYYSKPVFLLCDWKAFEKHFANKTFLYVTCFEAIEHIAPEETPTFMTALVKRLEDGGKLIVSTPCNRYEGLSPENEFHTNTFTPQRYKETLSEFFSRVEFFKQDGVNIICPIAEPQLGFTIAICGNAK